MSTTIYFAVASTLAASDVSSLFSSKMLAGAFVDASVGAAALVDRDRPGESPDYADLQAFADVQLVLGLYEDAEELYRRAQKAIRRHDDVRVSLSRNAGWQALFQSHLGTALKCFKRVIDDTQAHEGLRLESLVGAVMTLFQLGRLDSLREHLQMLGKMAGESRESRWCRLADVLREELVAQYRLRSSPQLADHIYWHSATLEQRASEPLSALGPWSREHVPEIPVLARRTDYLRHLDGLARGGQNGLAHIEAHLRWSKTAGLDDYYREARLEVALAALAGKTPNVAETMLHTLGDLPMHGNQHARWYLEYLYCQSKMRQQQGRLQDHSQIYARYALMSIKHVRADSVTVPATVANGAQMSDDISARLPGKYRRAYQYLVEHLHRSDLSVREVANHIGVSERALQAAFKAHLGYTPSELIRNRRMEQIRDTLLADDTRASNVLAIANRWGVQHRSTLLNGYRKLFNEAPSETLAR